MINSTLEQIDSVKLRLEYFVKYAELDTGDNKDIIKDIVKHTKAFFWDKTPIAVMNTHTLLAISRDYNLYNKSISPTNILVTDMGKIIIKINDALIDNVICLYYKIVDYIMPDLTGYIKYKELTLKDSNAFVDEVNEALIPMVENNILTNNIIAVLNKKTINHFNHEESLKTNLESFITSIITQAGEVHLKIDDNVADNVLVFYYKDC